MPTYVIEPVLNWVIEQIREAIVALSFLIQAIIAQPPRSQPGEWQYYLYGNALGLAQEVGVAIIVSLFVIALLLPRKLVTAAQAFAIVLVIATLGPLYVRFMDWIVSGGDTLARWTMSFGAVPLFQDTEQITSGLQGTVLILTAILGGFSVLMMIMLAFIVFVYEQLILFSKIVILIVVVLIPIGPRSQKVANGLISLFLLAALIGRPVAVLFLEMGQFFMSGANALEASFWLLTSLILAVGVQYLLFLGLFISISKTTGNFIGFVRGSVKTTTNQTVKVSAQGSRQQHVSTLRLVPSGILAAKSAVSASPTVAAATVAANKLLRRGSGDDKAVVEAGTAGQI
jgi:hypothetical protein